MANLGVHTGLILKTMIGASSMKKTPFVGVTIEVESTEYLVPIWLTAKNKARAREELRACGFNYKTDTLAALDDEDNNPLAGNQVPVRIYIDEYRGKQRVLAQILTDTTQGVSKGKVEKLEDLLRSNRKSDPDDDDIPF